MSRPSREGPRVFLSYRREDTERYGPRLYDSLIEHFGADRVVTDFDAISPGEDFSQAFGRNFAPGDVLIVLIGRRWLTAADNGLDKPDDLVRVAIETALRKDVHVIPTLVHGAVMPSSDALPESLRALTRRNAAVLGDLGWRSDEQRLLEHLEDLLWPVRPEMRPPPAPPAAAARAEPAQRRRRPFRWWSERREQRKADEDEVSDVEREVE
jgi:hypothetical protein